MIRFFGRKKGGGKAKKEESREEPLIEMLSKKVKDSDGNPFGEVVSAEEDFIVIKHEGGFCRFPSESVQNRFGELMLAVNIDMAEALREGEEWRNTGKDVIEENTFYDFTEKRREELERNERIMAELKRTRKIALQAQSEVPLEEAVKKDESEGEPQVRQISPRDFAEGKRAEGEPQARQISPGPSAEDKRAE